MHPTIQRVSKLLHPQGHVTSDPIELLRLAELEIVERRSREQTGADAFRAIEEKVKELESANEGFIRDCQAYQSKTGLVPSARLREAVDLGHKQALDFDRYWKAAGVLDAEISVDDAIARYQSLVARAEAAEALCAAVKERLERPRSNDPDAIADCVNDVVDLLAKTPATVGNEVKGQTFAELAGHLAEAQGEAHQLREDKARLDFLQAHRASVEVGEEDPLPVTVNSSEDFNVHGSAKSYDVRAAIDAARKQGGQS